MEKKKIYQNEKQIAEQLEFEFWEELKQVLFEHEEKIQKELNPDN